MCDGDALRLATVGVALGCFDKAEALDAADAAILNRDLRTLPRLYRLAKRTAGAALQETGVSGAVKLLVLIFGAAGLCSLGLAVFIQAAAVLFEAWCALRLLTFGEERKPILIRKGK